MWNKGTINGYDYWIKHYPESSVFGISGGCVSKLSIRKVGETKYLCNYDRGWDIRPKGATVKAVYSAILAKYN